MGVPILRVRDDRGNIIDIPAIKGEPGKDGKDGATRFADLEDKPLNYTVEETPVMNTRLVEVDVGNSMFLPDVLALEAGATYTVYWNGEAYDCVGQALEEDGELVAIGLGDGEVSGEIDTEDPFFIRAGVNEDPDGLTTAVYFYDGNDAVTLGIYKKEEVIQGRYRVRSCTSGSRKVFEIMVNDE